MPEVPRPGEPESERPYDPGLRTLLTYVFIALVLSVLAALLGVNLVIRWFGQ